MPALDSHDAIVKHISAAHRGKKHWIILGDSWRSATVMNDFVADLRERGLTDEDITTGQFELHVPAHRQRVEVFVLTLPKARVRTRWINDVAQVVTGVRTRFGDDRDIVVITRHNPELLVGAYEQLRKGKCFPIEVATNN